MSRNGKSTLQNLCNSGFDRKLHKILQRKRHQFGLLSFGPWTFESPTYSDTSVSMSGADRKSSSVKQDGTPPYSKRESYKYSAEVDSIRRRVAVLYRPGTTNRSRQLKSRYIPCRMVFVPLPVCSFQLNYFIVGSVWSPNSRANPNVSK